MWNCFIYYTLEQHNPISGGRNIYLYSYLYLYKYLNNCLTASSCNSRQKGAFSQEVQTLKENTMLSCKVRRIYTGLCYTNFTEVYSC